jgi:hypothetical protein
MVINLSISDGSINDDPASGRPGGEGGNAPPSTPMSHIVRCIANLRRGETGGIVRGGAVKLILSRCAWGT